MTADDARAIQDFGRRMAKLVERMANVVMLAAFMLPRREQGHLLAEVSAISADMTKLLDSITPTEGLDA